MGTARTTIRVNLFMNNDELKDDWRERGQEEYLSGLTFSFCRYTPFSETWEHDHCEYCYKKIYTEIIDDYCTDKGYCSDDKRIWICLECFNDFKEKHRLIENSQK